jgi:predicted transglutaminase-like cysteine proteinase
LQGPRGLHGGQIGRGKSAGSKALFIKAGLTGAGEILQGGVSVFSVAHNVLKGTIVAVVGAGLYWQMTRTPDSSPASALTKTTIPIGWLGFCAREPAECKQRSATSEPMHLTSKAFDDIKRINHSVNAEISPVPDDVSEDRWSYPNDGRGDCEDYALLKRWMLLNEDFPLQSLLITVVRNRQGEGHAVLMVRTDRGDFILDNLNDEVMPWAKTGYRFVKRQSERDPNVWFKLKDAPDEEHIYTHQTR